MQSPVPRILSLLPSTTEIVGALGWRDTLVGVTHECDVCPDSAGMEAVLARGIPRVTVSHIDPAQLSQSAIDAAVVSSLHRGVALYALARDRILATQPTLVLTQTLCEVCAPDAKDVDTLCKALAALWDDTPEVVHLEPHLLTQVSDTFVTIAAACGDASRGHALSRRFLRQFEEIRRLTQDTPRPRVLMFEWLDPPFGGGHWVPEQIEAAGGVPALAAPGTKSARLDWDAIDEADPDVVAVACCGFDLARNVADSRALLDPANTSEVAQRFRGLRAVQEGRSYAFDGNRYFARPAPSLAAGSALLACAIAPDPTALRQSLVDSGVLSAEAASPVRLTPT